MPTQIGTAKFTVSKSRKYRGHASAASALAASRFATGRPPELLHPALCSQHAYSCPVTHAALKLHSLPRPGASGVYEARLDPFGRFTIGKHSPLMDVSGFFSTTRSSNGHAHSRR